MVRNTTNPARLHPQIGQSPQTDTAVPSLLADNWFDPIEARLRLKTREFIEGLVEEELAEALQRSRYAHHRSTLQADNADAPAIPRRPPPWPQAADRYN